MQRIVLIPHFKETLMGMFDYKNYTSVQSAELVSVSQKLALYSGTERYFGLPGTFLLNTLGTLTDSWLLPNKVNLGIPDGWREVSANELGLPASSVDHSGYFTIPSPLLGDRFMNGSGPQARILVQENDGVITKIALSWAGTNDLLDAVDYLYLNNDAFVPAMNPLLVAIKDFALEQGLSSEDVLITGYSLGGGMTNVMAKYRETLADGFFVDSDYIAHASPFIYDNAQVIFNFGFKNDAVFRILGDATSFEDAIAQMNPFFINPNTSFESTTNNLILFTGAYGSPLWKQNGISMSIANLVQGWSAHIGGNLTDAVDRITASEYYALTNQNSRVIVDHLDGLRRLYTWVKDKTGDGKAAFILGNEHNNLLKSGKTGDYIDAGSGNDHIKAGEGADRINGGDGIDKVTLQGKISDYDSYRLSDGTLFMQSKDNHGIKQLESVEKLSFDNEIFTGLRPYDVTEEGLVSNRYLLKWRNQTYQYKSHTEGTDGNDELEGTAVFGRGGDDILIAHSRIGSLLHGGEGNDTLIGGKGSDKLYGAEGNDLLYGGGGYDQMFGGVGDDIFFFDANSGRATIKDFNQFIGDNDLLFFTSDLFANKSEVLQSTREYSDSVVIYKENFAVYIENTALQDIENSINIVLLG